MTTEERVDPNWGSCYGGATYLTDEGVQVWMHRKSSKVRFFDAQGEQVGPEQPNVFPAIVFAHYSNWQDLDLSKAENNRLHREVCERTTLK